MGPDLEPDAAKNYGAIANSSTTATSMPTTKSRYRAFVTFTMAALATFAFIFLYITSSSSPSTINVPTLSSSSHHHHHDKTNLNHVTVSLIDSRNITLGPTSLNLNSYYHVSMNTLEHSHILTSPSTPLTFSIKNTLPYTTNSTPSLSTNDLPLRLSLPSSTISYHLHGYHGSFPSSFDDFHNSILPSTTSEITYNLDKTVNHMFYHLHHHTTSTSVTLECLENGGSSSIILQDTLKIPQKIIHLTTLNFFDGQLRSVKGARSLTSDLGVGVKGDTGEFRKTSFLVNGEFKPTVVGGRRLR